MAPFGGGVEIEPLKALDAQNLLEDSRGEVTARPRGGPIPAGYRPLVVGLKRPICWSAGVLVVPQLVPLFRETVLVVSMPLGLIPPLVKGRFFFAPIVQVIIGFFRWAGFRRYAMPQTPVGKSRMLPSGKILVPTIGPSALPVGRGTREPAELCWPVFSARSK